MTGLSVQLKTNVFKPFNPSFGEERGENQGQLLTQRQIP